MVTRKEKLYTEDLVKHSSIESIDKEISNLNAKFRIPKFSETLEAQYKRYFNNNYIDTERNTLLIGCLIFLSFVWVDFWIYPEKSTLFASLRVISSCILLAAVYMVFYKKAWGLDKYALEITVAIAWIGVGIILIISYLLPNPYNIMYTIGSLPLLSGITTNLRNSIIHVFFTTLGMSLLFTLTLGVIYFYSEPHPIDFIQEIMQLATPMLTLFFLGISAIAIYLSFSTERTFRLQWLLMARHKLDSECLALLSQNFKDLSNLDDLTQVANRRQLVNHVSEYLKSPLNHNKTVSMVIMDVDYFKPYNDHYGHLQGDICLQKIAQCLESNCPKECSLVARYGGEEFVIFMPEIEQQAALYQANALHQAVVQLKIPHTHGINGQVTASFGVTSMLINEELSLEMFIKQADEALYKAKNKGRNQVAAFD